MQDLAQVQAQLPSPMLRLRYLLGLSNTLHPTLVPPHRALVVAVEAVQRVRALRLKLK